MKFLHNFFRKILTLLCNAYGMKVYILSSRVNKFIDSLEKKLKENVLQSLEFLGDYNYTLEMPISRSLGDGLFELRIKEMGNVRVFYAFKDGVIWVLHAFLKKTNKTPIRELRYAKKQKRRLQ